MSSLPNKLIFDIIQDRIYEYIVKAKEESKIIDPSSDFKVMIENLSEISPEDCPLVSIHFIEEKPNRNSASRTHQEMDLVYEIHLYSSCPASTSMSSDLRSAKRLFYLAAQIKTALTKLLDTDLGFDPGYINPIGYPIFSRTQKTEDHEYSAERVFATGKFTFTIGASFTPEDINSLNLQEIKVDSGLFETINQY